MVVTYNASVTIAFQWVYDAHMMSTYCRETQSLSYGFTRIEASTIFFISRTLTNFEKSQARRYIAGWSHNPHTGTARWSRGHNKNLYNHMIVGSWDNRREPALTSQGHRSIFELISWRLHYDCAVSVQYLQSLCLDCPVLLRKEIQGDRTECKHIRRC